MCVGGGRGSSSRTYMIVYGNIVEKDFPRACTLTYKLNIYREECGVGGKPKLHFYFGVKQEWANTIIAFSHIKFGMHRFVLL